MLGPDAAIDDADDDVLAGGALAAELRPQAAGLIQAEEGRGVGGGQFARHVRRHRDHVGARHQGAHFGIGQHGGKAVQDHAVLMQHRCARHDGAYGCLLAGQVVVVEQYVLGFQVQAAACGWLGRGHAGDLAGVAGDRLVGQLNDIGAAHVIGLDRDRQAGQDQQYCSG
jgi:hypothetical protein